MRTFAIALLTLSLGFTGRPAAQTSAAPVESPLEIVHVDGAKSPELIPQWSVWGFVFRVLSGGPRQLPTSVFVLVSKAEEALVIKEADAVQRIDAACQVRASKAVALHGTE